MYMSFKFIFLFLVLTFAFNSIIQDTNPPTNHHSLRILDINVWSGLDYKGVIKMGECEKPVVREKRSLSG